MKRRKKPLTRSVKLKKKLVPLRQRGLSNVFKGNSLIPPKNGKPT